MNRDGWGHAGAQDPELGRTRESGWVWKAGQFTRTGEPGNGRGPQGLEMGEVEFQGKKQTGQRSGTTRAETGWR